MGRRARGRVALSAFARQRDQTVANRRSHRLGARRTRTSHPAHRTPHSVMYLELHTSSAFSFLDGASLPGTLIERAAALGYPALALLDRDGVYGAPQFYRAAKKTGLKAIVGAELTIGHRPSAWSLPVLVATAEGYRNLCRLITRAKLAAPKGESRLALSDV